MTAFASKSCDYDNLWANPHFVGPQPEIGHVLNVRFLTQNSERHSLGQWFLKLGTTVY